jgi:hypothetical protein
VSDAGSAVRPRPTRPLLIGLVCLALVLALALGVWWWRNARMTELERALSLSPSDSARLSWTDWAAVRSELGVSLDSGSTRAELTRFLDRAYDRDLSSTSALLGSAEVLQSSFGFSPATIDWEMFSQSDQGAVIVLQVPDGTDFDAIADRLARLGFDRPEDAEGVWKGGMDLLPRVSAGLTPELQFLALDPDDRLIVSSDRADFLHHALDVVHGDADSMASDDAVGAAADAVGTPLSAALYSGDQACRALAMSGADPTDQQAAQDLLDRAGEVNPLTSFAMAAEPGGTVDVVLGFESGDQARTNADTRATLAAGPAPGQGGDFTDRYRLGTVTADGDLVRMVLHPREGQYVISDLSNGPLLFATC